MRKNWVEWVALALSVVAIAAVAGFLAFDGMTNRGTRAMPSAELDPGGGYTTELGWVVPATVRNDGDAPAERVVLEASARVNGEQQTSTFEIDFLPAASEVEVYFGFDAEPEGEVALRVVAFGVP
jgi:uncharacterized protein (TIGR02588 family)